ncbi:MAG: hypothetical protein KatS3mg087_2205 [Patescibacteria group bacterium]|nr:MAG: hypothetical protein KatS3mg087_2205 [Patescibacteria group bacterium]
MEKNLYMSDQAAINLFMGKKIQRLPGEYNWHPSAGINEKAVIVHFNGLKWTQWEDFLRGGLSEYHMNHFGKWVGKNPESYEYFVQKAREFE